MATDTAPTRSKWDPTRNLWQWPTLLAGLGLFWAVWQGILTIGPANPADALERSLQTLRSAVEATSPDPDALKALAVTTAEQATQVPEQAPFADFLLGSAHVRLADLATDPAIAREESILAAQFLDRVTADRLPNPEDDGARLAFRSAKAHAGAGRFVGASSPTLTLATRTLMFPPKGEHAGEAARLAGDLYLIQTPPSLKDARKAFEKYLQSASIATPTPSLARAKLRLGEVLLSMNDAAAARQWLAQIPADSPAEVLLPARVHLARLSMKETAWADAAKLWEQVLSASNLPTTLAVQAGYNLAVCKQMTAQPDAAALFERATQSEGPEKFAATVKLMDLALQGRDPTARTTAANRLASTLASLPTSEFTNPYVALNEVQATVEHALQVLPTEGGFPAALKLTESYGKVSPGGKDREKRAEVLAAWGESLRKQNGDFAPKFRAAAEECLALAGIADAPNARKSERLRRAALYFRDAGDQTARLDTLAKLVKLPDVPEEILGNAWVEYAEVLLANQRPDEALEALKKAMANGAGGTAARYKLARLLIDSGDTPRITLGMELLKQIGGAEKIPAKEAEYSERALVELGQNSLKSGQYPQAESYFRKQLGYHPNGSEAYLGRFLLGVCLLQQSARQPGVEDKPDDAKMRKEALDLFRSLVTDMDTIRVKTGTLKEQELWLRTQSALRVLQALQQMERLNEVIGTAAVVRRDCEGKVEELIALSMMYHAQKQANHPELAMKVLDEMRDVYRALPDSAFHGPGEYSKEYWDRVWFNPPPVEPSPEGAARRATPAPVVPVSGQAP